MFPEPSSTENTNSLETPAAPLTYCPLLQNLSNHIWACVVQPELESTRSKSLFIILWATYMVKKLSSQGKTSSRPCESSLSPERGRMWEEPLHSLEELFTDPRPAPQDTVEAAKSFLRKSLENSRTSLFPAEGILEHLPESQTSSQNTNVTCPFSP